MSLKIYFADFADFSEKAFAFTEVYAAERIIEKSSKPDLTFPWCPEFPGVVNPEFPGVANPEFSVTYRHIPNSKSGSQKLSKNNRE